MQVVRPDPDVEKDDAPEADNRQAVGPDRSSGADGQEIIEHAQKPGGQEKGDSIVPIPPLDHRVLDPGPDREAVGRAKADG